MPDPLQAYENKVSEALSEFDLLDEAGTHHSPLANLLANIRKMQRQVGIA